MQTFKRDAGQLAAAPQAAEPRSAPAGATGVRRVADLRLRGTAGTVPVRVRWPSSASAESSPPVIVFFPDAAPANGVDQADDLLCHELCSRVGVVVLCAPWVPRRPGAPDSALDRAEAALDWSADHADELGADPGRLVVAGRGAGAAAATVLALRARDRRWPRIERQLLILPAPGTRRPTACKAASTERCRPCSSAGPPRPPW